MWKLLNAKANLTENKGLISNKIDPMKKPKDYSTTLTQDIGKVDIECHHSCITGETSNNVVLNPDIKEYTMGYNVRLMFYKEQVGFITSIPNTISIKDDRKYLSTLTTYLAVKKTHRSKEVVQYLINQLMVTGHSRGITTGYFFGSKPKTKSAIPIYAWYRPLSIDDSIKEGYNIILPEEFGNMARDTQIAAARIFYGFKSHVKGEDTTYMDFRRVPQRMISLSLDGVEFDRFNRKPFTWKTYSDENGGIITCTTPYNILQPDGNIIKVALLIYCETIITSTMAGGGGKTSIYSNVLLKTYLDSMFYDLSKEGYSTVHGSTMGPLNYPPNKFFGPLLAISCGMIFIDFYNLKTSKIDSPGDISLMYL
jgi:hypothetical protein